MEKALEAITIKEIHDNANKYYKLMQTSLSEKKHVEALNKYKAWNALIDRVLSGELITERP